MTDIQRIVHKRGDTFTKTLQATGGGVGVNLTGYTLRSQIRDKATEALLAALTVTPDPDQVNNAGVFTLSFPTSTSTWTPGTYGFDIEVTAPDGSILSTATIDFVVQKDMTQ